MYNEGVIQFDCIWQETAPIAGDALVKLAELITWRDRLFAWGAIGLYPNGIGYGNISQRDPQGFWITGSQTGHLPHTNAQHYSLVDHWDIDRNALHCIGSARASSESLTHAALYEHDPAIQAIVHAHHPELWKRSKHQLPTTDAQVPYGTPAMAREMWRLWDTTDLPQTRILVMAGHEDGLLAFGRTLQEAVQPLADRLLPLLDVG